MGRVDITALTHEQLSQKLLECTKKSQIKEALSLVENGADPNLEDQVGNTAIHYAALGGYLDLVIKMVENGGNVRKMDDNGETPVHKAARRGNVKTIIALMAYDGDVNILNMLGQSALELAVIAKEVATVNLCCKLGAECALQDWAWITGDIETLPKNDQQILNTLVDQSSRYPGFKYSAIMFKVLHLRQSSQETVVQSLQIAIQPDNIRDSFLLYCGKMHPEYSEISSHLQPDDSIFSDVYELIAWGKLPSKLTIDLTIHGVPACSERLELKLMEVSTSGTVERFQIVDKGDPDEANYTIVTVTFTPRKSGSIIFAIVTTEVPETFTVTGAAVSIQPTMEPDAKIDIPHGAFEGQGQLQVNVAETQPVMRDDTESTEPLLITNIIDLTMSNGMQPKKAVKMKLPIHTGTTHDIVILASQEEYPEDEDDWEIIETHNLAKFVFFDVSHFSFYVAGSKALYKKAAKLANLALRKERRIEVFAMVKYESEKTSTFVIECVLKRQGKRRRKKWKDKGFDAQSPEYFECFVHSQQKFQLTFPDSLPILDGNDNAILIFNPRKKKNYMTFSLHHDGDLPRGDIKIEKMLEYEELQTGDKDTALATKLQRKRHRLSFVCGGDSEVIESTPKPAEEPKNELELLTLLTVEVKPPTNEEQEGNATKVSADDPNCSIKCTVIRLSSLKKLAEHMTEKEVFCLGNNLGLHVEILNELKAKDNFKYMMFCQWRPKRPWEKLVQTLIDALEKIDRKDLANMVHLAYDQESEFKYVEHDDD